jgi:hypothetical protein
MSESREVLNERSRELWLTWAHATEHLITAALGDHDGSPDVLDKMYAEAKRRAAKSSEGDRRMLHEAYVKGVMLDGMFQAEFVLACRDVQAKRTMQGLPDPDDQ